MRITLRHAVLIAAVCVALMTLPGARTDRDRQEDNKFRDELIDFFANIDRHSPTVLGALVQDEPLAAIQDGIRRMSPDKLATLQEAFSQVPNWKMAPEMLAAALPADTREGMEIAMEQARHRAARIQTFRDDVDRVYATARLLPSDTLKSMQLDQTSIAAVQRNIAHATPQALFHAEEQLRGNASWGSLKQTMPPSIPPRIRRGVDALSRRGKLGVDDVRQLSGMRRDIENFLDDVDRLPTSLQVQLDRSSLDVLRSRLADASPEMLFVLREELDSSRLQDAMQDVQALASVGVMDASQRNELAGFRNDLSAAVAVSSLDPRGNDNLSVIQSRIFGSSDEELVLIRRRIERVPNWKATVPAVLVSASSRGVMELVDALLEDTVDATTLRDLVSFRAQLIHYFRNLQGGTDEIAVRAAESVQRLEQANVVQLAVMRDGYIRMGHDPSALALLDLEASIGLLTSEIYAAGGLIAPSCVTPSLSIPSLCAGTISIPYVGSIDVCLPGISLPGINLQSICDALFNPLNAALSAITSVIDDITGVANTIFSAVSSAIANIGDLPDLIFDGLKAAFDLIAGATGLDSYLNPSTLASALGIAGNFWDSIPTVPTPPCPPDSTAIPLFGEVGESETAVKYSRYLWLFDKILEMVPDTEVSLTVKIPAQILYGGVEYLGICLDAAADARDEADTNTFRADVSTQFGTTQTAVGTTQTGVDGVQSRIATHDLVAATAFVDVDGDMTSLQSTVTARRDQVDTMADDLRERFDESLELMIRLDIESNLLHHVNEPIAAFQFPGTVDGYLEVVRDIVAETIDHNVDAGLNVNDAFAELAAGDAEFSLNNYGAAYSHYAEAYREAVR